MNKTRLVAILALLAPLTAQAQLNASWNLPSQCATNSVTGTFGSGTIQYGTSVGEINSVQNAAGAWCNDPSSNPFRQGGPTGSYWTQFGGTPSSAYGTYAPSNMSMVQLVGEVTSTITFSQAVIDPWIAVTSIGNTDQNGVGVDVTYTFSDAFTVAASNSSYDNRAYWDDWATVGRAPAYSVLGNAFTGREFSGVLKFTGTFTELSFTTKGSENWHGFTVGASEFSTVPEPSTYALMGVGLLALGAVARRKKQI